jgi:cytochrome c peroxidase
MANNRANLLFLGALLATASACGSDRGAQVNQGIASGGSASDLAGSGGASAVPAAGSAAVLDDPDPSFTADERASLATLHYDAARPPADISNSVADDPAARVLGQRLFFEPALSGALLEPDNTGTASNLGKKGEAGKIACSGCHMPNSDFVDTRSPHQQISLAAQWTRRRSPSLLNIAFMPVYNWDGRRDTLWNQAIGVFESSIEFNTSRLFIARQIFLLHRAEYEAVFGAMPNMSDTATYPALSPLQTGCDADTKAPVCHGKPGDNAEYDGMDADAQRAVTTVTVNVAKAIAAYLRLLRSGASRFDRWLDGEPNAMSRSEQRGAALFVGKAKCVSCHSGPNLSDGEFHNVGLRPATVAVAFTDTDDRGAAEGVAAAIGDPLGSAGPFSAGDRATLPKAVTATMEGAFRTPMLRNIDGQPSFMHTAQLQSLSAVVRFFDRGGDPAGFPGTSELEPLNLSDREEADVVAFMRALEGPGADASLRTPPPAP